MLDSIYTYRREFVQLTEQINRCQLAIKSTGNSKLKNDLKEKLWALIEQENMLVEIMDDYQKEGYSFSPMLYTQEQLAQVKKVAKMALARGWRVYGTIYYPGFQDQPQVLNLQTAYKSIEEWENDGVSISFYPKSKKITFTCF